MRLFVAIEPDEAVAVAIERAQAALRRALGEAATDIRWTARGNAHVTLHFLGEIAPDRLPAIQRGVSEVLPLPPFTAALGSIGAFPPHGRPATLWIGLGQGVEEMRAVHRLLGDRLRNAAVALEVRQFSPHFTIGRVRDRGRRRLPAIRPLLATTEVAAARWTVSEATLFSSDLGGSAPRYTALHRIRLTGS